MMTRNLTRALLLGASLLALCGHGLPALAGEPGGQDALTRGDFAQGMSLTPRESGVIHTVLLPGEVYRGVVQRNFGDLRVYNQAGVQVPHAVRPLAPPTSHITQSVRLPIFPLRAAPGAADPRTALVLQATRDSAGMIIDIRLPEPTPRAKAVSQPSAEPASGPIVAYLIDASSIDEPMDALQIALGPRQGDQVLPVLVEASDDLSNFRSVGQPQALVRLSYDGHEIEQSRLELSDLRARFLRLTWGEAPAPTFEEVRVETGRDVVPNPRAPERIQGKWETGKKDVAVYDLGGAMPIERVRIVLSEDNTLLRAQLEGSRATGGSFDPICEGTFYRVRQAGALLESEPIAVHAVEARVVRMRAARSGGGLGSTPPELEIHRRPEQLLYAARGQGPFELVFGHHGALPSAFSPEDLLSMLPSAAKLGLPEADTTLGPLHPLAGSRALTPPPPPLPLKKYALWAVLVFAVTALGVAALRLARAKEP